MEEKIKNHPVISLILERARSGSKPLRRDDEFKLGLAIEGGAMRGVISAGMATALESLGLLPVFDAVYGTSAGAFNGAFFLARQAAYGTTIYYENLIGKGFINLRRLFLGRPIARLEYIFDPVITREKVLDWQAVIHSPIPLNIVASSVNELQARILNRYQTRDDLFAALHASSQMLLVAGKPVEIGGDRFLDGGVFEGIPINSALQDRCTHVLLLLTRPKGNLKEEAGFFDRVIFAGKLDRLRKGLGACYLDMPRRYREAVSFIREGEKKVQAPPYMLALTLHEDYRPIGRMEKNPERLRQAARDGMGVVFKALAGDCPRIIDVLLPFTQDGHPYQIRE